MRIDTGAAPAAADRGAGGTTRGLRSVVGDSAAYGIGLAALPLALLLATPLVARELDPTGFGTVEVLASIVALVVLVSLLGMDAAVMRSYFDYPPGDERRPATIRFGLAVSTATSLVACALVALGGVAARGAGASATTTGAILAASALIPLGSAQAVARLGLLLRRRRTAYVVAAAIQAAVGVPVALALVLAGLGPVGYFLGLGVGAVATLTFTLAAGNVPVARTGVLHRSETRLMLGYGLPLVPAAVATWAVFTIDRSLIAALRDLGEVGQYAVASKVAAPLMLATSAFAIAWGPFILGQARAQQPELRARALTAVTAGVGALFVPLVLFAVEFVQLLGGDDFRGAAKAVPGIGLGWLGFAAAVVLSTEFSLSRRTRVIGVATAGAAALNVAFNLALVPRLGFVAAGWVTAASFLLLAVAYWVCERRSVRVPYRLGRLAVVASVVSAATALALLTGAGELPVVRALALILGVGFLVAVVATDDGHAEPSSSSDG